jgi:aspartyl-tRNA(Asn)/glutamyl-tRNA(Gln) amidotransferase subunit A
LFETPNFTIPFNVAGVPALSVCNGFSSSGLPLALQIVGRPFEEARVLQAGHAYEQATPWKERRPVL